MNMLASHFWHVIGEVAKWIGVGIGVLVAIAVVVCILIMRDIDKHGWH